MATIKKNNLSTSLLDERVRVIISADPEKVTEQQRVHYVQMKHDARCQIWAYWGDYARVRAVYMKDGDLCLSLQRENTGELFECFATHVQIAKPLPDVIPFP
jgi:hypothetical protein